MMTVLLAGLMLAQSQPPPPSLDEMLLAFADTDESGAVDSMAEIARVTCEHWQALQDQSIRIYGQPLWLTTGLDVVFPIGGGVSMSPALAEVAAQELARCVEAPERERLNAGRYDVARWVAAWRPADPLVWEHKVSRMLIIRYASPGQLLIDSNRDVQSIPCEVWQAVEAHYRESERSLATALGLENDSRWMGGRLGLSSSVRAAVHDRLRQCGVAD